MIKGGKGDRKAKVPPLICVCIVVKNKGCWPYRMARKTNNAIVGRTADSDVSCCAKLYHYCCKIRKSCMYHCCRLALLCQSGRNSERGGGSRNQPNHLAVGRHQNYRIKTVVVRQFLGRKRPSSRMKLFEF